MPTVVTIQKNQVHFKNCVKSNRNRDLYHQIS